MEITDGIYTGYEPDENKVYTTREKITAFASLGAGAFFTEVIVRSSSGAVGYSIWFLLLMALYLFFRRKEIKLKNKFSVLQLALIIVFTVNLNFISSEIAYLIDLAFLHTMISYFIYNTSQGNTTISDYCFLDILFSVFKAPFKNFSRCIKTMVAASFSVKKTGNIKYIFLGLIMAVPSVVIVLPLLLNSDNNMKIFFEDFFNKMYSDIDMRAFISRFLFSMIIGSFVFSVFYTNKYEDAPNRDEQKYQIDRMEKFEPLVMCVMVIPICILYAIFFVSQLSYFISAFFGTLPEQFSYSEYARQGFFELCEIAVINLLVIVFINFFVKKPEDTIPLKLKICIIVLSGFTEILIATAVSKMVMYISEYGFTRMRVCTTWFMMLLAGCFALIITKQIHPKLSLVKSIVILSVASVSILSFGRPDAHIAKWNIQLYEIGVTEELDIDTLSRLSYEAVPYIDKFAQSGDRLSDQASEMLMRKAKNLKISQHNWTKYTYPVAKAEKIFEKYLPE